MMLPNLRITVYVIVAIIGFVGARWIRSLPDHYRDEGRRENEARHVESTRIAKIERNAEIERVKHEQTEINRKVVVDHENKLKSLSDRLADSKRVGLRVPKSACSGFAATPETASTEGNNETEYVRLPERIESGLFRIAERAQEINIQLGACQSWIIQNGFYLSAPTSTPNK